MSGRRGGRGRGGRGGRGDRPVCTFHLSNTCTKGRDCPFAHTGSAPKAAAAPASPVSNVCRFYLEVL